MLGLPVAAASAVERAWSTYRRARSAQRQATRTARTARHAVTATAHAPQEAAEYVVEGGRMPRPVKWVVVVLVIVYPFWLLGHTAAGLKVFNLPFSPTWGEVFGFGPSDEDVWEWVNPGGGAIPAGWSPDRQAAGAYAAACPESVPAGWFDRDDDEEPDRSWLVGTVHELGEAIRAKALDPDTLEAYGRWWGDVVGVVVSAAVDDLTGAVDASPRVEAWEDRHGSCSPLVLEQGPPPATGVVPAGTGPGAWGGYANGRIPSSALCPVAGGGMARCDAAAAFGRMSAAYAETFGRPISVTDTYRSYEGQVACRAAKGSLCADPGTSNHGWGLAFDLGGGIQRFGTAEHQWMRANAPGFGFDLPGWARMGGSKPEPWHWEFVGGSSVAAG